MNQMFVINISSNIEDLPLIEFDYRNYKKQEGTRRIRPVLVWYGNVQYHPRTTWLVYGWDEDKKEKRQFAIEGFLGPIKVLQPGIDDTGLLKVIQSLLVLEGIGAKELSTNSSGIANERLTK